MYVRRAFLENSSFESVVFAIAHELAHIVLDATGNELFKNERAVDITAMVLGFAEYCEKCYTKFATRDAVYSVSNLTFIERAVLALQAVWTTIHGKRCVYTVRLGYLSQDEAEEASRIIRAMR